MHLDEGGPLATVAQLAVRRRAPRADVADVLTELLEGALHLREKELRLLSGLRLDAAPLGQSLQLILDGVPVVLLLELAFHGVISELIGPVRAEEVLAAPLAGPWGLVLRLSAAAEEAEEAFIVGHEVVLVGVQI